MPERQMRTWAALLVVVGSLLSTAAEPGAAGQAAHACAPDATGSYGAWAYVMFPGAPTHRLEIKVDGLDVVLFHSFSDGATTQARLEPKGICQWSDPASEDFDEWYEITAEGLHAYDRNGLIRLIPPAP